MISTFPIKSTRKNYFKLLLSLYWRRKWWLAALWLLFAIICLTVQEKTIWDYIVIALGFGYPVLITIQYWFYVRSLANRIFFQERWYEIDEDKLVGHFYDGTASPIRWVHFVKYLKRNDRYLLYLSQGQFVDLPFSSFRSEEDREWFETSILTIIAKRRI